MPTAPNALGNIVSLSGDLPEGSPPTSYAAHAVLKGTKGSVATFGALTLLRSLLIAPGLALAGVRGKQLLFGSMAASGFISLSALVYCYASDKKKVTGTSTPVDPRPINVEIGEAQMRDPSMKDVPIDTTGEESQ